MEEVKILFLAANPSRDLRLDEEIREITAKIRAAEHRDALELVFCGAVRPDDLQQALLEHQPHILHFSGHGSPSDEIILLDEDSNSSPLSQPALVNLLQTLKDNLQLVVLNACYSRPQAEAIATVVDCTIGMNKAIGDEAAIKFAAAFYRALGFGRSVQTAFDLGLNTLTTNGTGEQRPEEPHRKLILGEGEKAPRYADDQIPQLMTRHDVDASTVFLVKPASTRNPLSSSGTTLDLAGNPSHKLRSARDRVKQLMKEGAEQAAIDAAKAKVLEARREIRAGGRLRADDVLLDRYELLECVGSGGFATVWKCFDEQTMKFVAAKILHPSHREERTRIDRFFRGARMMKQLSHENIVRVLDERCSDEGFHFYIMEFIDGDDFHEAILSGRISREAVLDIIVSAADALHHAHTTLPDLVHRDVKPSNILLTPEGQVRVTDFDLVRTADTTGGTRTGSLGTFMYTAPESLQKAGEVDARADVFSLGMTTIFGLYGHELPATAFRHTSDFIDSLDCGEGIKRALKQAVEWESSERFASMRAFADALRATSQDDAIVGDPLPLQPASGEFVTNSIGMRLKLIPAGEFMMGSEPQHRVRITKPFYLGIYTVTQKQYEKVMEVRPWQGQSYVQERPDCPAVYVSWHEAVEFCRKLSEREGVEYRLPSEAEWEYACRAGTTTPYSFGDNASELGRYAWYKENAWNQGERYAHSVGQKLPDSWGLYDMHGNVWEWCRDWYGTYVAVEVTDPSGPASGSSRVLRGGSFNIVADNCRSAYRNDWQPGNRNLDSGFRVSRTYS